MGMSTVTTHLILFIAALGIATGLIVGIKNFADESQSSFNAKSDEFNKQLLTDISIEVVHYNNITENTTVYVRNTGQSKLKPEEVDVYIDSIRIPRNSANRTIEVLEDTEIVDTGIWNPKEELRIEVDLWLNETITHEVRVTTPYETSDTESFSIA